MRVTLYGIKNCDTVKKARAWLDGHGVEYSFHDYKTAGVERDALRRWCERVGWQMLLNRSGTTFRKLPEARKAVADEAGAIRLMLEQHSIIKRPVVEMGEQLLVGFQPDVYEQALMHKRDLRL